MESFELTKESIAACRNHYVESDRNPRDGIGNEALLARTKTISAVDIPRRKIVHCNRRFKQFPGAARDLFLDLCV